jgi:Mg2+/Co2+ transporter CorB
MDPEIIGNLTTIIKILIMTIAPAIAVYIGTDSQTVIAFLTAVLTFVLAVIDAKYPNTLKVFEPETIEHSESLNDEYEA